MNQNAAMPRQVELMWPILRALDGLGGSASIHELDDRVASDLDLGEGVLNVVRGDGPQTEFAYRCAWARTRLRRMGAVDNSGHGVWAITEAGRRIGSADQTRELDRNMHDRYRREQRESGPRTGEDEQPLVEESTAESWQGVLLSILREIEPAAIDLIDGEMLCTLLKETSLGVMTETVERVTPDRAFFDAL